MKSITVVAIFMGCVVALANAGLFTGENNTFFRFSCFYIKKSLHFDIGSSKGPYNQGIIGAMNRAKDLSIADLNARNAKQGDLAATLTNIVNFPLAYVHLFKKSPKQVLGILIGTLRGLGKGRTIPKKLKLALNNAVDRLQHTFSTDISQVLTSK